MPDELLMIMTSNGTFGDSGRLTGVWVEEVCMPLKAFRDAGFIVSAASPLGGRPPIDPRSAGFDTSTVPDLEAWLDGAEVLADVDPGRYAAVFLAGGHGTMWDFPGNEALTRVVGTVASRGVVSAVCHGPAGLIGVAGPDGKPLVARRTDHGPEPHVVSGGRAGDDRRAGPPAVNYANPGPPRPGRWPTTWTLR